MYVPSTMGYFDKLPLEIRREIYKYLLVNPILAIEDALEKEIAYELDPAILRTCRQIHNEASEVLYSQPFCASTLNIYAYCKTPFTRKISYKDRWKVDHKIRLLAMRKVRRWKIKIYDSEAERRCNTHIVDFCQAVCRAAPKQIDVYVGTDLDENLRVSSSPAATLHPLTMLRNVGLLTIQDCYFDFSQVALVGRHKSWTYGIYEDVVSNSTLTKTLKMLAEGDEPVERYGSSAMGTPALLG
jgi:hypothetical protein